ncbi:MAG TPA: M48 family metalloprotease [Bacteroidales bacterium]|nr:M48 family metalloprotease [Bacteroidales bacterium]
MLSFLIRSLLLVVFTFITTTCAINPVTGKSQIMFMSEEQELQMGKEYDPQVVATFGEYKNDALLSLLKSKAEEIGKISQRPNIEWHIRILDSPVINAFAVPGGYVYFTRGILASFTNEAEMVGVLGHEMGHVIARHSASQQTKQQIGQLLLIGGMLASDKVAQYGQEAMQAMQLLFLKFSRDNERQSDELGVEYMSKIGYDGNQMADFFEVLNKQSMDKEEGGVPTFLSTHPNPADREDRVRKLTKAWQDSIKKGDWKVNSESYLSMIDGMVYGEDPRQGYTEGNTFYHPEMKFRFSYPSGWQFQNTPMQVGTAPKDGKAMIILTLAQQKTAEEAAQATTKQLGLSVQESKRIRVNNLPAVAVIGTQVQQDPATGQRGPSLQVLSFYIEHGGAVYVFHGLSSESDFRKYQREIESTLSSFAPLNDQSKLNVKPKKVHVTTVKRSGSFSQVLASQGVPKSEFKEHEILNNLDLNSDVPAGTLVKIIGE